MPKTDFGNNRREAIGKMQEAGGRGKGCHGHRHRHSRWQQVRGAGGRGKICYLLFGVCKNGGREAEN